MRLSFVWLCVLAAGSAMAPTIGGAGADECCGRPLPKVVYGLPPVPMAIPPTGYVLDPSDAARPVYPVDPYATGAAPFARPTYSEGGYAYADSYPYTDDPYGYGSQGYGPPAYGPYGPQAYGPYGSSGTELRSSRARLLSGPLCPALGRAALHGLSLPGGTQRQDHPLAPERVTRSAARRRRGREPFGL
jgi:hypothetical protein